MDRAQGYYEQNQYERALAIFRVLERDLGSLNQNEQARYAYLRGMTDYRLGFSADARHWLAIGKAIEQEHPGGLLEHERKRLDESLDDLNKAVFGTADRFQGSRSTLMDAGTKGPASAEPAVPGPSSSDVGESEPAAPNQSTDAGAPTTDAWSAPSP